MQWFAANGGGLIILLSLVSASFYIGFVYGKGELFDWQNKKGANDGQH